MNIENIAISAIKPYAKNAKKHPKEQVDKIMRSIERFGWAQPLVVDKENVLIIGHGRLEAAKKLKLESVPVLRMENLCNDEVNALRLADNKLNESEWDMELVNLELGEMSDELKELTGFEPMEVLEAQEDDFDTTPPEEPKTKLGDLYQLGEHRLLCGDATKIEDVERLTAGKKADMVFTDPPYGIDVVTEGKVGGADFGVAKKGEYSPVIGDSTTDTAKDFIATCVALGMGRQIIWGGNYFTGFLPKSDGWLIWDKRGDSGIRNTFADGEMAWCSFHTPIRIYTQLWNGMIREGEKDKRVHPTQKPIRTLSEILVDFTDEQQIVFDGFGGSGSTLIACEQTGRKCLMMELDPKYCDVIVNRWEKLTGKKAELL